MKTVKIPCCERSRKMETSSTTTTHFTACRYCGYKPETLVISSYYSEKQEPVLKPIKLKIVPPIIVGKHLKPLMPTGFQPKFFKEGRA